MKKIGIGLMSGTSLDGIDAVISSIEDTQENVQLHIINANTYPYNSEILKKIRQALHDEASSSRLLCSLNVELAYEYSKCVFAICEESGIDIHDVDFIACHGQTIYHITENTNNEVRSSLQLGDGSVLANLTNTTVVSNFRTADITVGGQGAPLVPFADYVLFQHNDKTRLLQNIGGISNVTCLPKGGSKKEVFAFDNGPGNMMIDYAMQKLFNKKYDNNGETAKQGDLISEMFDEILSLEYFNLEPPKSTGRELFGNHYTATILEKYKHYSKHDIIATLSHITAFSIADSYKKFILSTFTIDEVIISGGGAYNGYLLKLIKSYLDFEDVFILEEFGYSSEYKEALAFLILGNETLEFNPSNIKNATGASKDVILGQVSYVMK